MTRRFVHSVASSPVFADAFSPVRSLSGGVSDPTLVLNLNFLSSTLPSGLTFSRASAATDIINGVLTTFSSGSPRISAENGYLSENQSTNILQNSNVSVVGSAIITAASATGPDGVALSAKTIGTSSATSICGVSNSATVLHSAATYTISGFFKSGSSNRVQLCVGSAISTSYANFLLSGSGSVTAGSYTTATIVALANGWYRCSMSYTATANTTAPVVVGMIRSGTDTRLQSNTFSGTETIYFYGLQSEQNEFATSYIDTTTASVTRAADILYSTNIPWFTSSQGTFFASVRSVPVVGSLFKIYTNLSDASTINYHSLSMNPVGLYSRGEIMNASSTEMQSDVYQYVSGRIKQAMAYATNDAINCVNANLGVADTTVNPPASITRLDIGNRYDGIRALGGYVESVKFFNVRKTNAELQAMTT